VKCIENEIPFELPEGWEWSRITGLCIKITDGTHHSPDNFPTGDYMYVTAKNIKESGIVLEDITYVTKEVHDEIYSRCNPEKGDILYIKDGATSGVATINDIDTEFSLLSSVALLKPSRITNNRFLCYVMQSPYFYATTRGDMKGIGITRITLTMINSRLIPVAPLEEQVRITECLQKALPAIFELEDNNQAVLELIELTKSKILDLAIKGKLVPQNPDDEPAFALLERVRAEKEALIKQGKLKRDKKESIIYRGDDNSYYQTGSSEPIDVPYEIPETWVWSNLKELCNYGVCDNISPETINSDAWILDLEDIEKDTGKVLYRATNAERKTTSTKHSFRKGMILYSKLRPYLNKVVLADEDGYCTSEIIPLQFSEIILPRYAQLFLMSPFFVGYANHCSYGMKMPRLGTHDGEKALFAIPPYQEQARIVDMVDKLHANIDIILESLTM